MTRSKAFAGMSVLALVTVLAITLVPAQSAGGSTQRFRVCDQNKSGYSHDVDTDGDGDFSPGDISLGADKLLDPDTGKKAARDAGSFLIVRRVGNQDALVSADFMFFMPNGKLMANGLFRFGQLDSGITVPITGGTGHFAGMTGVLKVNNHPCNGASGAMFHFELS